MMDVIEGFYAVEQYAPDYTTELTRLARGSYGHSQFQIRWGAEEEKHSDLWRNVLLFARARSPAQLDRYTRDLRANAWVAPFDKPLEMLFYTVLQERATQLIYLKTAALARLESGDTKGSHKADPVLGKIASTIAIDEAAHYDFFLALARVHLYYFPEEAFEALVKVLRNFVMPAARIVPNYDGFIKALYDSRLFGPSMYGREVAKPALTALGVESVKAVEDGLALTKGAPGPDGTHRPAPFAGCNLAVLESTVRHLFDRIGRYESEVGLDSLHPTVFAAVDG
jgi:acyl-[acyl-carrier-protein] desaturase